MPPSRSDLDKAQVEGADFTNALVDKTQQLVSTQMQAGVLLPRLADGEHLAASVGYGLHDWLCLCP